LHRSRRRSGTNKKPVLGTSFAPAVNGCARIRPKSRAYLQWKLSPGGTLKTNGCWAFAGCSRRLVPPYIDQQSQQQCRNHAGHQPWPGLRSRIAAFAANTGAPATRPPLQAHRRGPGLVCQPGSSGSLARGNAAGPAPSAGWNRRAQHRRRTFDDGGDHAGRRLAPECPLARDGISLQHAAKPKDVAARVGSLPLQLLGDIYCRVPRICPRRWSALVSVASVSFKADAPLRQSRNRAAWRPGLVIRDIGRSDRGDEPFTVPRNRAHPESARHTLRPYRRQRPFQRGASTSFPSPGNSGPDVVQLVQIFG